MIATYADLLHAQASAAADQITVEAAGLDRSDPGAAAQALARGAVATSVADSATCCLSDQLAFAVVLAAELAVRATSPAVQDGDR